MNENWTEIVEDLSPYFETEQDKKDIWHRIIMFAFLSGKRERSE